MAVVLALCAAVAYGMTDFAAGVASRRLSAVVVTATMQVLGLLVAGVGVLVQPGIGPRPSVLAFGALSGVGSTVGPLALYEGMTQGRMAIVASLSAVLTAVLPVLFGLLLGQSLTPLSASGVVLAVPAIALVSWQPAAGGQPEGRPGLAGAGYGVLSGVGFALLFVALDRAGTRSVAWPLLPGQAVALLAVLPFARHRRSAGVSSRGRRRC